MISFVEGEGGRGRHPFRGKGKGRDPFKGKQSERGMKYCRGPENSLAMVGTP